MNGAYLPLEYVKDPTKECPYVQHLTYEEHLEEIQNLIAEVQFLRYFYSAAGDCFGPADRDVYEAIKQDFMKHKDKTLPKGYGIDE